MDIEHVSTLITDYTLDLLSPEERRRVEGHARVCDACREALRREGAVAALVRGAVYQAAAPAPGRLAALRPAVARRDATARPAPRGLLDYRRLAPVTMLTVLLALGLLFGRVGGPLASGFAGPTPTLTATRAETPTATLAAAPDAAEFATSSRATERHTRPAAPPAVAPAQPKAPQPAATPIITAAAP